MTTKWLTCSTLILSVTASLSADVRFTMRVDVRKTKAPAQTHPMLAKIGDTFIRALAPDAPSTSTFAAGEQGARIEFGMATPGVPKGAVLLRMSDGGRVVLNPADRTYWKLSPIRITPSQHPSTTPKVSSKRTGTFSRIAGVRAERIDIAVQFEPPQAGGQTPAEMTDLMRLEGELWVTNEIETPAAIAQLLNPAMQALGLDTLVSDGFVVRQVLRSPLFNGQEVESTVTRIDAGPVPQELLEIPKDYREVPVPATEPKR